MEVKKPTIAKLQRKIEVLQKKNELLTEELAKCRSHYIDDFTKRFDLECRIGNAMAALRGEE